MLLLWLFLSLFCAGNLHAASSGNIGPCDRWWPARGSSQGVVVVAHGMNLKPSCMDEMAEFLASSGFEVLRPAFTGHCGDNENYLNVTSAQWEADARRVHALAAGVAKKQGKPLFLVAYSFTAPIFQSLEAELPFERRVYFAPALSTRWWYPALVWVAKKIPSFTFESKNVPECAANRLSGARPLIALDAFLNRWQAGAGSEDRAPALVLAEPDDELVSYGGLKEIAAKRTGWRFEEVSNRGYTLPHSFHHLIIDSRTLGSTEWNRVRKLTKDFLTDR